MSGPAILLLAVLAMDPDQKAEATTTTTEVFEAPKYGLKVAMPRDWPVKVREKGDLVFIVGVTQDEPDAVGFKIGSVACELALAPENLNEYRTRFDTIARRGNLNGWRLARNEVVKGPKGDRLESLRELRVNPGGVLHELAVRVIAHRQMYTFILTGDDATFNRVKPVFDTLVASAEFSPPNTGADRVAGEGNRWVQREFQFAIDLPEGWRPSLAPSEIALLYANAPARGIWSDNLLVLAQPHRPLDLKALEKDLPEQLRIEEPNCEVLSCKVARQGEREALETVVRTRRGPFSMTVLERRFRGGRFDYEVKFTVESERFDALAPTLKKCLDSFEEVPGDVPAAGPVKPA